MATLISIVIILASILLVIVVFIQNPKGGGLSSDFGAASQLGGVQKTNDFIDKSTWTLAGTIMVLSIVLTIISTPKRPVQKEVPQAKTGQAAPQQGNAPQ